MPPKTSRVRPSSTTQCDSDGSGYRIIMFVMISIAAVLFLIVLMSMVSSQRDAMNYVVQSSNEGFESETKDKKTSTTLVFLRMDGCGWCERFIPVWEEMKTKHGKSLTMVKYERSEPSAKKYLKHATGFPTILLDQDGDVKKFSGERTVEGLESFLKENGVRLMPMKENFESETDAIKKKFAMLQSQVISSVSSSKQ